MKKPIVYMCIQYWIKERSGVYYQINRSDIFRILGELFHIPKEERSQVLKELVEFKIIKHINRDCYLVLG